MISKPPYHPPPLAWTLAYMHMFMCMHTHAHTQMWCCHEDSRIINFFLPEHTIKSETTTTHLLFESQYPLSLPFLNLNYQTVVILFDTTAASNLKAKSINSYLCGITWKTQWRTAFPSLFSIVTEIQSSELHPLNFWE